jgi:hypothetical protein
MKKALCFCLFFCATTANVADAFTSYAHWTGNKRYVKSPTNQDAIDCEYDLGGNKFWREFLLANVSNCPDPIEVE